MRGDSLGNNDLGAFGVGLNQVHGHFADHEQGSQDGEGKIGSDVFLYWK